MSMFVETVILYCIDRFHGERTVNAVYYLITGKKSAQTIQDAAWFQLRPYFNIIPDLGKFTLIEILQNLAKQQLLMLDRQTARITEKGREFYREGLQKYPLPPHFDGFQFHKIDEQFWKRLSLVVQIFSHWAYNETRFIPIQRESQQDVKRWLYDAGKKLPKKKLISAFYDELIRMLQIVAEEGMAPEILVYRLSGYRRSGLTFRQLAERLELDEAYCRVLFRGILQQIIAMSWNKPDQFPLFASLMDDLHQPIQLTRSSALTFDLLQKGKTVAEIARLRQLKPSTVQDHIVEIALMDPNFSIDPFVKPQLQEKIKVAVQRSRSRKLRRIKELVPDADYFSIRLVLASRSQEPEKNNRD